MPLQRQKVMLPERLSDLKPYFLTSHAYFLPSIIKSCFDVSMRLTVLFLRRVKTRHMGAGRPLVLELTLLTSRFQDAEPDLAIFILNTNLLFPQGFGFTIPGERL